MQPITKLLLLPSMIFVLLQCADTYTWIERADPLLYINDIPDKFFHEDSIKTSFKVGTVKSLEFTLTASSIVPEVILVDKAQRGLLKIENKDVETGTEIPVSLDHPVFRCVFEPPLNADETYEFLFRLRDLGDLYSRTVVVKITVFQNLLPVANFTVTKQEKGDNSYTLDAGKSYDPDEGKKARGGGLKDYAYTITGPPPENHKYSLPHRQEKSPWTPNGPGIYTLVLVVRDNNGKDSPPFSQEYEVK